MKQKKDWTEIFPNIRQPHYGECVECYAHQILSHGFMDQGLAETANMKQNKSDHSNPKDNGNLKMRYLAWARQIKHPEILVSETGLDGLLELGWKEFLND